MKDKRGIMKKTRLSSVASLLAASVLMVGCMADVGGQSESEGGAAQGPNVVGGEAVGEAKQPLITGTWSDWQPLGGTTLKGPTIASRGVGRLDAFMLGTDNNVYVKNYANGAWGPWGNLGAPAGVTLVSSPDAVSSDANNVSVVARASDSKFYILTWTATSGWSSWNPLPGVFSNYGPGVSSRGPGILEVFGTGTDNQASHTWQSWLSGGGWICCTALGSPQNAPLASNVTSVSWDSNKVDLFVRGSDNGLWTRGWDGTNGWNPGWSPLGGQFLSGFGAASWGAGHLAVFGVGPDSQIWQKQYDAGWSAFTSVGAPPGVTAVSEPDAVSWGAGRIDIIVRGSDNQLWVRSFTASTVGGIRKKPPFAAGDSHNLVVKSDGTVWSWGHNYAGQLGNGRMTARRTPGQVLNLAGVVAVAAGQGHSLALKSDGTLWAWGWNDYGQLGDGTRTGSLTPVQVPNLTGVVAMEAGQTHSLAVKSDGTLWSWGNNAAGQLGDGAGASRFTPGQVLNLTGVVAVAAGKHQSLAVKSDGTLWTWGSYVGDGTAPRSTPGQVSSLTGVVAVEAGNSHSLALKSDGSLWAWGENSRGQLGVGTGTGSSNTPVQVSNLTGVVAVASGFAHGMALKSDGTLWLWGDNTVGQLGDGTTTGRNTPWQLPGLSVKP